MATYKTTATCYDLGFSDAWRQCEESGEYDTPDGGWDSWLINGLGHYATCRYLGEPPEDSEDDWSEAMAEKLAAYHKGAMAGATALEQSDS